MLSETLGLILTATMKEDHLEHILSKRGKKQTKQNCMPMNYQKHYLTGLGPKVRAVGHNFLKRIQIIKVTS
jgi:hypothetical protein